MLPVSFTSVLIAPDSGEFKKVKSNYELSVSTLTSAEGATETGDITNEATKIT